MEEISFSICTPKCNIWLYNAFLELRVTAIYVFLGFHDLQNTGLGGQISPMLSISLFFLGWECYDLPDILMCCGRLAGPCGLTPLAYLDVVGWWCHAGCRLASLPGHHSNWASSRMTCSDIVLDGYFFFFV